MPTRFRLREILASKGMSQRQLARVSGVSLTIVSRIATNRAKQVALSTLGLLAAALGVEPGELLTSDRDDSAAGVIDRLVFRVDARRVDARLNRFPGASRGTGAGARQPRWLLRIDRGPTVNGPLTWESSRDPDIERAAIAGFIREREEVARSHAAMNRAIRERMRARGAMVGLAEALGVSPERLSLALASGTRR